jgi:hypothetical protein
MLQFLTEKGYPMMMSRGQVTEMLGVSRSTLAVAIKNGHIKVIDGKVPIGSVANYLCG